ncbi:hypothetical protein [Pseudonocardia endophytica]|uniref:Uncharacterized protein n=1 Tax=Pseudonocardia endophytica TaxID=401976 RepID=A0A4R1HKH6_PSEEN|nr:hypothetical protein [Pseudonocardia endophytica]TCK21463.1 hypothetical protein EV378_5450 [Pseudonocardia endophytica]
MILVLCHVGDHSARWVAERLGARARREVQLVFVEALADPSTVWCQEIRDEGVHMTITLGDGRTLRDGEIDAVLNRMVCAPATQTLAAVEGDEDYARSELTSFAASWVRGLAPRVVNPPTPQGLSGRWRPAPGWRVLARRAGLPVVDLAVDSADPSTADGDPTGGSTVLTVGGEMLVRDAPDDVRAAAARLLSLAETPILGLRFDGAVPGENGWRLLDATPYPDLSSAGEDGVTAIAAELAA